MKTFLFYCLLLFLQNVNPIKAQQSKFTFHSINTFGMAIGQSGTDPLFQTVNGLAYGEWFSGIGFGANYYRYNSYPLFLDTRRYFSETKKAFIYGNIGYNFSGKNTPAKEIIYSNYKFSGGVYTDFGIGYRKNFTTKSAFLITAGFSYNEVHNKVGLINPVLDCAVGAACPLIDYSSYTYGCGTIVLKAGIAF
ncbi:MAG: hypothetical protein ABI683_03355 [Ginsengibacter sp.]